MTQNPTPQKIMSWIRAEIDIRRHNAGMSGSWSDGGASELEKKLDVYASAIQGLVPQAWQGIVDRYMAETDAEYQEYLRLEKKFGQVLRRGQGGGLPKC